MSSGSRLLGRSNSDIHTSLSRKKWRSETSPERTKVWTEPHPKLNSGARKVAVVYYLSRNGQLQHPHFIEVPLSSDSLYLRDFINRLNSIRGKAMVSMYSWSSKRSYKNGFVWNDLEENDFIYPVHGQDYVLKGSELLDCELVPKFDESVNSSSKQPPPPETPNSGEDRLRRNQSWSAIGLHDYKVVYRVESGASGDASTQTDDKRRRRRAIEREENDNQLVNKICSTIELSREEISGPPSESSPETLKCDAKLIAHPGETRNDLTVNNHPSGRMKASTVLMQLLTCGSISLKNCEDHPGLSLMSQYKPGLPRGGGERNQVGKDVEDKNSRFGKKHFSGSLIQETNEDEFPVPLTMSIGAEYVNTD